MLHEAEARAAALDDPRRLGQVALFLSLHCRLIGAYDQATAAGERALALSTASGAPVLHALANINLGQAYQAQGDYHRAIACHGQAVVALDGVRGHERFGLPLLPAVNARAYLAWCYAELGRFAEGWAVGEEGLRIARAVDHPASLMLASWGDGLLALRQGDLPRALPLLERAVGLCQDADLPIFYALMAVALGAAYTLGGRVADAVPLLTQALGQSTTTVVVNNQALCSLTPAGGARRSATRQRKPLTISSPLSSSVSVKISPRPSWR